MNQLRELFYRLVVAPIRVRSREGWVALVRSRILRAKQWVHEHGEMAAILGFVGGIIIVVFLELVAYLALLALLLFSIVWLVAKPESAA